MKFTKLFKNKKNIIIGALHTPPLLGYKDFPGMNMVIEQAHKDLLSFEEGGADAIIFENNYDIPHKTNVDSSVVASMFLVGQYLKSKTKLPIGISVLWNDYKTALSVAKLLNLDFVRIPVFVDKVKTRHGIVEGNPTEIKDFQKTIKAENIFLLTDIHVKHAEILSNKNLIKSAKDAIKNGSDAIVVTGSWTGDAPSVEDLISLKNAKINKPVFIGSGLNKDNVSTLFKHSNGAIVSTSLKRGSIKKGQTNLKSFNQRINKQLLKTLISKI